jgi:hypothetical protein
MAVAGNGADRDHCRGIRGAANAAGCGAMSQTTSQHRNVERCRPARQELDTDAVVRLGPRHEANHRPGSIRFRSIFRVSDWYASAFFDDLKFIAGARGTVQLYGHLIDAPRE